MTFSHDFLKSLPHSEVQTVTKRLEKLFGLPIYLEEEELKDIAGSFINVRDRDTWCTLACFTLTDFPGCCGICVSTGAFVHPDYQRRGIGTYLNQFRQRLARAKGFGVLLCTDVAHNNANRRVLAKTGWKDIHSFRNPRTDNTVNISVVNLVEEQ